MAERWNDEAVARILGAMTKEERTRALDSLGSYLPSRYLLEDVDAAFARGDAEEGARRLAAYTSHLPVELQELVFREAKDLMDPSKLRIRIIEDPLTAHNLNMIIAAVTDLHTRCWLIEQYRLADLMNYAQ